MKTLFFVLPFLYIGGNGYLFLRTLQAFAWLPLWGKLLLSLLFWAVAFALFGAIGLRESQLPDWVVRTLFEAGSVWMVFLLYMVMSLVVFDLAKIAFPAMGPSLWYALPVTTLLLGYGYWNYRHPQVEPIEIALERHFEGEELRLVAVSDMHLGYGTGVSALKRYVELINKQQPDVVVIVGDLIDNSLKPLRQEPFGEELAKIEAPLGVYMVAGNHEYISGINEVTDYLKKSPITLLRDTLVTLPGGIRLIGRDDRSNRTRKPLAELLAMGEPEQPAIVLDHQPYALAEADSLGVDILLCGHTHHGQVFPLNLLTDCLYEQSHGYRKWSHAHIWVSSGLSLWGPPFRIGTKSDLAVIQVRRGCQN